MNPAEHTPATARRQHKEEHELAYWREIIGPLQSDHQRLEHMGDWYEFFYTTFFGLKKADYAGLRLLDIGCGPMGTLEWADVATERVGLDPLAAQYLELVRCRHAMQYVAAEAEHMPFPDAYFDQVSAFNSLDHVEDVDRTIREIKRVVKPTGRILLIVEINHDPSDTEPHRLDASVVDQFAPEFRATDVRVFGVRDQFDLYGALKQGVPYREGELGLLCCRFAGRGTA